MDNFKCPGCRSKFDPVTRPPVLLSRCSHHLCGACVDPKAAQVVCPVDGLVSQVGGVPAEETHGRGCPEHHRKFEFFCLNDEREICSLCGLFGEHKGHHIIVHKELEEVVRKLAGEVERERATVELGDDLRKGDGFTAIFERRVVESLKACKKQVDALYQVPSPENQKQPQKAVFDAL